MTDPTTFEPGWRSLEAHLTQVLGPEMTRMLDDMVAEAYFIDDLDLSLIIDVLTPARAAYVSIRTDRCPVHHCDIEICQDDDPDECRKWRTNEGLDDALAGDDMQ